MLNDLFQDFRYAVRGLTKAPGFTAVTVLTLALGLGATTAIYSVVDAVVLRALPFDEHDRLIAVGSRFSSEPVSTIGTIPPQDFNDWRARQQIFDRLSAVTSASSIFQESGGEPEELRALRVSWDFFEMLRVHLVGRGFVAENEIPGQHNVVIVSHAFWHARFGGAPDAIGQTISLDGSRYEIVGIAPRDFSYPEASVIPAQVFVPFVVPPDEVVRRVGQRRSYLRAIGRLKDGVSLSQASTHMDRIAVALERENPVWNRDRRVGLTQLHNQVVGERTRAWMLFVLGAVACVLLIACANVANLLIARGNARINEIQIRAAIGASQWRVMRQLLIESAVLAAVGTVTGLVIAWFGIQVLRDALTGSVPRVRSVGLDLRVLSTTAALGIGTSFLFGLLPAVQASKSDLTGALKEGARGSSTGRGRQRLRSALIVAEMALAVILLVGAGLFIGSFTKLMRVDTGFDARDVLTASVLLRPEPDALDRAVPALLTIVDRVRQIPGVQYAAFISGNTPMSDDASATRIPGWPQEENRIRLSRITPDYHRAMRIQLLQGRAFTSADRDGATPVTILSEAAARKFLPGVNPIGRFIDVNGQREIVGVTADVRHGGPETETVPEAYVPLAQTHRIGGRLIVRTTGDPLAIVPEVRRVVFSVLPDIPLREISTMQGTLNVRVAQRRLGMLLLTMFGILGLVIAVVGLYGLMRYIIVQRTREIGVRVALGATRTQIVMLFLRNAARLMILGVVTGSFGAWLLSTVAKAFVFQIEPTDVRVFAMAVVVLMGSAVVATIVPARRAARVDPLVALRYE